MAGCTKLMRVRSLIFIFLLFGFTADVYSDEPLGMSCDSLHNLKLQHPPKRVLIIPLLSRMPHANEHPRWSEQPARTLQGFYRTQFKAVVMQLRNVWSWTDYYQQAEILIKQSLTFDRVIFISHGGFDGPVLTNAGYLEVLQKVEAQSRLFLYSEAQPGLMNETSITYDNKKNSVFNDYIVSHQNYLASMNSTDIWQQLKGLEKHLQPLDNACFKLYCSSSKLITMGSEQRRYQLYLCELICRESLFELKTSIKISPERFFNFTKSLKSLVTANGLIYFGACNPGSKAPKIVAEYDQTELLINSTIAGGPHQSYVHLINAATGLITAGPIGDSSAEDIVNRLVKFEIKRHQHNLCLVTSKAK